MESTKRSRLGQIGSSGSNRRQRFQSVCTTGAMMAVSGWPEFAAPQRLLLRTAFRYSAQAVSSGNRSSKSTSRDRDAHRRGKDPEPMVFSNSIFLQDLWGLRTFRNLLKKCSSSQPHKLSTPPTRRDSPLVEDDRGAWRADSSCHTLRLPDHPAFHSNIDLHSWSFANFNLKRVCRHNHTYLDGTMKHSGVQVRKSQATDVTRIDDPYKILSAIEDRSIRIRADDFRLFHRRDKSAIRARFGPGCLRYIEHRRGGCRRACDRGHDRLGRQNGLGRLGGPAAIGSGWCHNPAWQRRDPP